MKVVFLGDAGVYDAFMGKTQGGAENQIAMLAKALVAHSHDVTCILARYDGVERNISGVKMRQAWNPRLGLRGLRFFSYRIPALKRALAELAADIYYVRGFSLHAPALVDVARDQEAVSVIGLAHDVDLKVFRGIDDHQGSPYQYFLTSPPAAWYFRRYALRQVDWVGAQTKFQMARCWQLGLRACYLPNVLVPPEIQRQGSAEAEALFIGSISRRKGVAELLQLAQMLPDVKFEIVGSLQEKQLQGLLTKLQACPNVRWLGGLPHLEAVARISCSKLVINTSPTEGFSNVFLEAWALNKPVISLNANPDDLLVGEEALGACAFGSLPQMAAMIREYLSQPAKRQQVGERAKYYVAANHSPEKVCAAFENLIYTAPTKK